MCDASDYAVGAVLS
jgi:hypothetical protein